MNKTEGYHLKIEKLQLLFVIMPAHYLLMEICDSIQINLRCKLMRLGVPNRIDVVESNLESEFDCRILVDSDSNDLIESI